MHESNQLNCRYYSHLRRNNYIHAYLSHVNDAFFQGRYDHSEDVLVLSKDSQSIYICRQCYRSYVIYRKGKT